MSAAIVKGSHGFLENGFARRDNSGSLALPPSEEAYNDEVRICLLFFIFN
jgi:hypothetical protein